MKLNKCLLFVCASEKVPYKKISLKKSLIHKIINMLISMMISLEVDICKLKYCCEVTF